MNRKYKLLVASSLVSVIATGCSSFGTRSNADPQTDVTGSGSYTSQQAARSTVENNTTQTQTQATTNGRTQQWYIDQYNRNKTAGTKANTAPNGRTQQWYIDQYNRQQAQKATQQTTKPASNGRTQQWYIDRFNREQAAKANGQAYVPPKPIVVTKPYVAPAYVPPKPIVYNTPTTKTQTQYVDYTGGVAATSATPTNKNLYTGSYQQPNTTYQQYQPKTYTGGASTTGSNTNYTTTAAASSTGAGTYSVKKGDTVFEVMRQTGVYWKEIISMNNLQAPSYTIQPGQVLRLR